MRGGSLGGGRGIGRGRWVDRVARHPSRAAHVGPPPVGVQLPKQRSVADPSHHLPVGPIPEVLSVGSTDHDIEAVSLGRRYGVGEDPTINYDFVPLAFGFLGLDFSSSRERDQRDSVGLLPKPGVGGDFAYILSP